MFSKLMTILLFTPIYSFFIKNNYIPRKKMVTYSHFSKISTQLKDKDLLVETLKELNYDIEVYDKPVNITGYGNKNSTADIVIKQENGIDIGFLFNGETYELVTDLYYWRQAIPPDMLMTRLTKSYSINSVLKTLESEGYTLESLSNNIQTDIVEIEVSKYLI